MTRRMRDRMRADLKHAEEARHSEKALRHQREDEIVGLQKQIEGLHAQINVLEADATRTDYQLAVLSEDRERLTLAVETLSRRLASPDKERWPRNIESSLTSRRKQSIHDIVSDVAKTPLAPFSGSGRVSH
jgi:chromosome segregation ATPase